MPFLDHPRGPLLARLLTQSGPAVPRTMRAAGTQVVAVPGRYSVTYLLLDPDGVAVVDVGSATDVPRVLDALAAAGRSPADVRCIVPTHLHLDHVMGIDPLALRLGVPICLGEVAHRYITAGAELRIPDGEGLWHVVAGWPLQGLPFLADDDKRAAKDFTLPWRRGAFQAALGPVLAADAPLPGLPGWTVLVTPGHADEEICLFHAASGYLIAGDTIRNYFRGEWDPIVVDEGAFSATRLRLASLHVSAIFPGHGPVIEGPDPVGRLRTIPWWAP